MSDVFQGYHQGPRDHRGDEGLEPGCFSCGQEAAVRRGSAAPRDDVLHTTHWRVAHAFNSTLPGWLVLLPRRHVTAFTGLAPEGAAELGTIVRDLSRALEDATGCVKTYLMQFSEADGFSHLHLHLVPRAADLPDEVRGPRVFAHLVDEEERWLPEHRRDATALDVRRALVAAKR